MHQVFNWLLEKCFFTFDFDNDHASKNCAGIVPSGWLYLDSEYLIKESMLLLLRAFVITSSYFMN